MCWSLVVSKSQESIAAPWFLLQDCYRLVELEPDVVGDGHCCEPSCEEANGCGARFSAEGSLRA